MYAIFLQLLTPRPIRGISSTVCIMLCLNDGCIPIAAFLGALIWGKKNEKKMMEGICHEKLNEAYGQVLGEPDNGSDESTPRFGNYAETCTIKAIMKGNYQDDTRFCYTCAILGLRVKCGKMRHSTSRIAKMLIVPALPRTLVSKLYRAVFHQDKLQERSLPSQPHTTIVVWISTGTLFWWTGKTIPYIAIRFEPSMQ